MESAPLFCAFFLHSSTRPTSLRTKDTFSGDYAQHPMVSELLWSVGVRVAAKPSQDALQPAPAGYRLESLPDVEAAVLETTVGDAATDGLALLRWMVEEGFVQRGPTRMEYRSHEGSPTLIPARIIVPMRRRPSGLRLSGPKCADAKP
jgi:hypothetical protein